MNKMMETCKMLIRENDKLKRDEHQLNIKYSLLTKELDTVLKKYILRKKVSRYSPIELDLFTTLQKFH